MDDGSRRTDRRGLGWPCRRKRQSRQRRAGTARDPTAAALLTTFTPRAGHTPILVVVGEDQPSYEPVWPPTIMINKATATEDRHQTIRGAPDSSGSPRECSTRSPKGCWSPATSPGVRLHLDRRRGVGSDGGPDRTREAVRKAIW